MLVSVQNFEWFSVEHLPIHKKDNACKHLGLTPNSFFMVIPFVKYVLRIT